MSTNEELIKLYKETNNNFHLNTLYEQTVKLLKLICNQFSKSLRKWEFNDLLAEANVQWYLCVESYNSDIDCKFSTFLGRSVTYMFYNLIRDNKAIFRDDSKFAILRLDGHKREMSNDESSFADDIMNFLTQLENSEYDEFEKKTDYQFITSEIKRLYQVGFLKESQYEVIMDYYYNNKSRCTIALEQNKTRQAVDAVFKRTIHKLRKYYENDTRMLSLLHY